MEKYEKLKVLNKGKFEKVYLCRHIETNESYVIKTIPIKGMKEEDIQTLKQTLILLKEINSNYVIKCSDSFIENSNLYIVLEYSPNRTILNYFLKNQNSPVDEELIWKIFLQISLGLAAFHRKKIIHRNLKPRNIIMFDNNTLKIGSVGFSSYSSSEIKCSLYSSPEEVVNKKRYSEKSDIWGVGAILYELSTLQLPFSDTSEILNEEPESIPKNYSEDLQNLINELLEKDPDKRPTLLQIFRKENIKNKLIAFNLFDDANKLYPEIIDISENEIKKLFEKYPSLDDRIDVEIKKEIKEDYIYYGEWLVEGNTKHGRGIQISKDGRKYEGYWKNDKQDLKGIQSWFDGRIYEGEFKEGKRNGKGIFKYTNGDIYEGEWKDDKKEGQGIYIWLDSGKYSGEWKNDKKEGEGIRSWSNGDKYIGQWNNDKIQGQGIYIWLNGCKYFGEWENSEIEGQGIYTWPSGSKYLGRWKKNKIDGQGIETWRNGLKYIGELKNGKREGEGIITYPDGEIYVGKWKNNEKEGQGIITRLDCSIYFSEWKKDKIEGQGIEIEPSCLEMFG